MFRVPSSSSCGWSKGLSVLVLIFSQRCGFKVNRKSVTKPCTVISAPCRKPGSQFIGILPLTFCFYVYIIISLHAVCMSHAVLPHFSFYPFLPQNAHRFPSKAYNYGCQQGCREIQDPKKPVKPALTEALCVAFRQAQKQPKKPHLLFSQAFCQACKHLQISRTTKPVD